MKKILVLLMFCIYGITASAQTSINETQKLATLCKVWGFLKYYHPQVAKGNFDWDAELIKKIPQIKSAKTKEEINKIYADWIDELGKIEKRSNKQDSVGLFLKNLDLNWISDLNLFDKKLIEKLNCIKENRARSNIYTIYKDEMVSFENENPYKDSIFPSEGLRYVSLFRYWNIINYYFPYKYLIGQSWDNVLVEMIPVFKSASNSLSYVLAAKELTTKTNDNHALFRSEIINKFFGRNGLPFKIKIIDNKAVIFGSNYDSICNLSGLKQGDVILKINGKEIMDYMEEKLKYIGFSNEATKWRNRANLLLDSESDSIEITYERGSAINTKYVKLFLKNNFKYINNNPVCRELAGNIGYIDLPVLKMKDVDSVMSLMMNKKALIINLRGYPKLTAAKVSWYLNKEIKEFAMYFSPDSTFPGVYKYDILLYAGVMDSLNWYSINKEGTPNPNYYKGKVVLLVDEQTQSQAEFSCMAFQTAPDVITIGSQTSGADGDTFPFMLPGGIKTFISFWGVCYPDKRPTQRIGIVPDIEVKYTVEGLKLCRDEVLERAIEYINTGK